ncbi:MAG: hypothetical protein CVU11_13280 [Bacteroidetes bacterium HGW-Bacteroidetes-6]|jgi:hypothetical protein|nr:MAG: hypothetical protein CVU11_13280 [Bacteroidetes bacterium HGW-Bacteroidetes-6]
MQISRKTKKIYLNTVQEKANLIHSKNYFGVIGRGSGKSQRILAIRTARLAFEMPGADFGFIGNSYLNLQTNLVPNVVKGWKELGYVEGYDFVVDERPPKFFKEGKTSLFEYMHVITWITGAKFFLISDERPENANGRSLQHLFGDEIKLINYEKMSKSVFPAIRGERMTFGKCPQFQGFTFTTDMPDPETGQWLFNLMNQADPQQIEFILRLALMESEIILKMIELPDDHPEIVQLENDLSQLRVEINALRINSTYAEIASTLVNIDALGLDYLDNMLIALGPAGFKSAILSILMPSADVLFYAKFNSKTHCLPARYHYAITDQFGIEYSQRDSRSDAWTDPSVKLIGGADFGNMNSLVVNQSLGREFRTVKCMHVLQPDIIDDLADMFCNYYKYHREKVLDLYYDRAGNNRMPNSRSTVVQQFRFKILERKEGWIVNLKSLDMKNVPHDSRKLLIDVIHSETDNALPIHRIDECNAPEYVNSIRMAPFDTFTKKKDKRSEKKRNLADLPMNSTNYSDANDYALWGMFSDKIGKRVSAESMTPSFG